MCDKKRFRTELDAKIALTFQKENGHRKPKECVRCYPCPFCHGYHLTSQTVQEYRRAKRYKRQE